MRADVIERLRQTLGPDKVKVLTDIFARSIGTPRGIPADRYRADHPEYMEILDRLQADQLYLRRQQTNTASYEVTVFALPVLVDDSATVLLERMNSMYAYMQTVYRERLGKSVTVGELIAGYQQQDTSSSVRELQDALFYMAQNHGVWSALSNNFPYANDGTMCIAEDVLRKPNFDALLQEVYNGRELIHSRHQMPLIEPPDATSLDSERPASCAPPYSDSATTLIGGASGFTSNIEADPENPLNAVRKGKNEASGARDFSQRYGYRVRPSHMVREGAPDSLRSFVLLHVSSIARGSIYTARDLVSSTIRYVPNPANQTVDEIWSEIESAVRECEWFRIYDLVEEVYRARQWRSDGQETFVREVNQLFEEQNIGWRLQTVPLEGTDLLAPEIVIRGNDGFEAPLAIAMEALEASGRSAAERELREALHDLSRRPGPDLTGAVHHAIAALECVAADVCGEGGQTLGQIVKRHPHRFPAPLGDAVNKLYGFASDRARHVSEGKAPRQKEAELVVSVAAALTAFLLA